MKIIVEETEKMNDVFKDVFYRIGDQLYRLRVAGIDVQLDKTSGQLQMSFNMSKAGIINAK